MGLRTMRRSVLKAQGYPLHEARPEMNTRGQVKGPRLTRPMLVERRLRAQTLARLLTIQEIVRKQNKWWRRAGRALLRPVVMVRQWRALRAARRAKTVTAPGRR